MAKRAAALPKVIVPTSVEAPVRSLWPQMTGQAISDYLGFSAAWLSKLEKAGRVKRKASGFFDGGEVCKGYIAFLKDDTKRSNKTNAANRQQIARAEKLELENAAKKGELVEIETVQEIFAEIFAILRQELGGVPASSTRDLKLRAEIEKRHNDAFDRCGARFASARQALRSGRTILEGDEEAEA
jgi:hypothetical protein